MTKSSDFSVPGRLKFSKIQYYVVNVKVYVE